MTEAPHTTTPMRPATETYLQAIDSVPGWFHPMDQRLFVAIDDLQRELSIRGDLFEIGAYCGKSAILLGYFVDPGERLVVCDLFEGIDAVSDEEQAEVKRWYPDFGKQRFVEQYLRFHAALPELIVGPSSSIDPAAFAGSCRFVHVDGSHVYEVVKADIQIAKQLLHDGGVVAFDDISTPHDPGAALAVWEEVLRGRFLPICLTEAKLYGTWDLSRREWPEAMQAWAVRQDDVECEVHTLAGWKVPRLFIPPRPVETVASPDPPVPPVPPVPPAAPSQPPQSMTARSLAKAITPPAMVSLYRRLKGARPTH